MARVALPGRLVAVAGRTTDAIEPGAIRSGLCSAVQRPAAQTKTGAILFLLSEI